MDDAGYSDGAVAVAAMVTVLVPPLALVGALLAVGGQNEPRKRSQLRRWAWISGVVTVVEFVAALLLALY